jgi:ribonucleoside-diphosphate reductase alpha chain|tara:strand:+ start:1651 stop:3573 length:1923 start_codon:yes stop_codon:yes gene_type:complete
MLPSDYQSFIHQSRYSRWLDGEERRETWQETVTRLLSFYRDFIKKNHDYSMPKEMFTDLYTAMVTLEIMPSMRAMMTAGNALERNHIAAYNCSYLPVDSPRAFDECLYILMHGTGVGFSVERQYINQLPGVPDVLEDSETTIIVQDSKEGWFRGFKELINLLYAGMLPRWDMSRLRPAGAKLKTFGGRASGPEPLDDLFSFSCNLFKKASGRKLTSIECHDLMCKIADVVVVGGVRRSALISLSNLSDDRMRHAKSGSWWDTDPHRALANNSVCYTDGSADMGSFMREWTALYESKSGERGIFNRQAAQQQAAKYGRRDSDIDYGTNPCCEIILRPKQFCNLSEVVVKSEDTAETLQKKVELATILGTIQACFVDFKGLSRQWVRNTEEERLLGVSLTGILDNKMMSNKTNDNLPALLSNLRLTAVATNSKWAKYLGIEPSAAITCVKPSGTVSQLVNAASGIHPRHSEYYIRTVRADKKDPLTQFMTEKGFPVEDELAKPQSMSVFNFPIKSPKGALTRHDLSAIDHLKIWQVYSEHWCEHKPSITVSVQEHEWMEVGAYVYKNFNLMSGISFLPMTEHTYKQAPYQDCDKATYDELLSKMPTDVDWKLLAEFEAEDNTHGSQTLNCSGDVCEVVDLVQ